ncbi:MAG: hypothetical protein WCX88_02365, partial [Patescibacteria group bacterium]
MLNKIKNIFCNFSTKKKTFFISGLSLIFILGLCFIFRPEIARAWDGNDIAKILLWPLAAAVELLSLLATGILAILSRILQYNDFVNSNAVEIGWVLVRDVCNLFFILLLLYNAFLLVLGIEKGSPTKNIIQILLTAILINFSKSICGLIIDFAQVIMLTFVNAFKDSFVQNFTSYLGIEDILKLKLGTNTAETGMGYWELFIAMIFAFIIVVIVIIILISMVIMMLYRIIILWILVLLSPLAFMMQLVPFGKKYASEWWDMFIKQIIIGPFMAFFLWLSLAILSVQRNDALTVEKTSMLGIDKGTENITIAISEISSSDNILGFLIATMLLVTAMSMSQKFGVAGTAAMGTMGKWAKKAGIGMVKKPAMFGLEKGKEVAQYAGRETLGVAKGWDRLLGKRFKLEGGLVGTGYEKVRSFANFSNFKHIRDLQGEVKDSEHEYYKQESQIKKDEDDEKITKEEADKKREKLILIHNGSQYSRVGDNFYKTNKNRELLDANGAATTDKAFKDYEKEIKKIDDDVNTHKITPGKGYEEKEKLRLNYKDDEYLEDKVSGNFHKANKNGDFVDADGAIIANDLLNSFQEEELKIERDVQNNIITRSEGDDQKKKLRLNRNGIEYAKDGDNFFKVNQNGEFVDAKGVVTTNLADRVALKEVLKENKFDPITNGIALKTKTLLGEEKNAKAMTDKEADMYHGERDAKTSAIIARRSANQAKISKEASELSKSGTTPLMLAEIAKDTSASLEKRQAAAMVFSKASEMFGVDLDTVKKVKSVLGLNQLLLDEFNTAINKRHAHLNYDTSTEDGQTQFIKSAERGEFNILAKDAYADANVLKTFEKIKAWTLPKYLDSVKEINQSYRDALTEGLKNAFSGNLFENGSLDKMRLASVRASSEMAHIFEGTNATKEDMYNGLTEIFSKIPPDKLAYLRDDNFDLDKVKKYFNNDEDKAKEYLEVLGKVLLNYGEKNLQSMRRNNASPKLMDNIERLKKTAFASAHENDFVTGNMKNLSNLGPDIFDLNKIKKNFDDDVSKANAFIAKLKGEAIKWSDQQIEDLAKSGASKPFMDKIFEIRSDNYKDTTLSTYKSKSIPNIANINPDVFDVDKLKDKFNMTPAKAQEIVKEIEKEIIGWDDAMMNSVKQAGIPQKLLDKFIEIRSNNYTSGILDAFEKIDVPNIAKTSHEIFDIDKSSQYFDNRKELADKFKIKLENEMNRWGKDRDDIINNIEKAG